MLRSLTEGTVTTRRIVVVSTLVVLAACTTERPPPQTVRVTQAEPVMDRDLGGGQVSSAPPAGTLESRIRPMRVQVPEAVLIDLRRRIAATRWPPKETVPDQSQGVQLATMQDLLDYWGTDYDWRKAEARLNDLPNFVTQIDDVDIHFIHVRSPHPGAMPLIMTHGWPGSVFELLKVIGPLTDPVAYGGRAEDAFDLVLPSLPGYGFSGKPTEPGWSPDRIARAWDELMKRLGYPQYVAQGGDWGSIVTHAMARQAPPGLIGIHVNLPAVVPREVASALQKGQPPPAGLSDQERVAFASLEAFYRKGTGYQAIMATRPQTLAYGLADSPALLAAWLYDKFTAWTDTGGQPERALTKDEMLDDITLYWVTNTGATASRLYWEAQDNLLNAVDISIPVAVTVFPGELYRAPRSWAERSYHQLIYFHEVDRGGHFAAFEQPDLFVDEVRAAFRPLR
ncbi:MAG: Epoxide hydrolase [Myxococcales bacterium]|nr:Epoxide hydrolase [Myxococcales bacterium]